jgi:hypothetical protein
MDFDLSPRLAQQLFDGEAGSYHSWSSTEFPLLAEEKVGAGRLVLQPRGFALPHYADSSKIGYVLQGIYMYQFINSLLPLLLPLPPPPPPYKSLDIFSFIYYGW